MGATDGRVVSTTKIVDHGPATSRWNLVILGDGYRTAELPAFRTHAEAFVQKLYETVPFNELWCAVNVFRVDVESTDSGADDPATCGDGSTGAGTTARTFFDSRFCVANTRRLLAGDDALALSTSATAVPQRHAAVVIVNSSRYGGAGGAVAWFSTTPQSAEIGIHELGHSFFRLTDEYGDIHDTWTGGEPAAPNATINTDHATTKWRDLITAPATPVVTLANPDCTRENTAASPVPAGTVGLFEGANRARCGAYRAEYHCKMRTLGQPFCAVCRRVIRDALRPFLPHALAPFVGVQFRGSVDASSSRRWFTYNWPACWHVSWTVVPTSTRPADAPDIRWRVQVERASRERITYWIRVTNLGSEAVDVEARYAVLARH
jgi:hypothetical protein